MEEKWETNKVKGDGIEWLKMGIAILIPFFVIVSVSAGLFVSGVIISWTPNGNENSNETDIDGNEFLNDVIPGVLLLSSIFGYSGSIALYILFRSQAHRVERKIKELKEREEEFDKLTKDANELAKRLKKDSNADEE